MKSITTFSAALTVLFSASCHLRARSPFMNKIRFADNLYYSADQDAGHGCDLYLPLQAKSPVPVAVFVHGGYWVNQTRSYFRPFTGLYENFGLALASRGIATAVIDYRTHPRGTITDQYQDVESALRWIRENAGQYGIDAERLCIVGHSAGGHLALLTAWRGRGSVSCVVALSPILDIAHMRQRQDQKFNERVTNAVFGNGEHDYAHSPLSYLDKSTVRSLLLFGGGDYPYLLEQAETVRQKVTAGGFRHISLETLPGLDHSAMVLAVNSRNDPLSDRIAHYVLHTEKTAK